MSSEDRKDALEAVDTAPYIDEEKKKKKKKKKGKKGEEEEDKINVLPPVPASQMVGSIHTVM